MKIIIVKLMKVFSIIIICSILFNCASFTYPIDSIKSKVFGIISVDSGIEIAKINGIEVRMNGGLLKAPYSVKLAEGNHQMVLKNSNTNMQGAIQELTINIENGKKYKLGKQYISAGGPRAYTIRYTFKEIF